jgi:hypothetical protein
MYGFAEGVTEAQIDGLAAILRGCGRYIPEVLDSAVGRNGSDTDVTLVWEHAYESTAAYERYMRHPYHISVLDRYLLPDSPELMIAGSAKLGLGLLGYEIEDASFRRTSGIRRLVAFKFLPGSSEQQIESAIGRLRDSGEDLPGLELSIVARNSMGLQWFPDGWSHLWEQAYGDETAMARGVEREAGLLGPPISSWVSVHYRLDPARPDERPRPGARTDEGHSKPVYLVEQVELRPGDAAAYMEALEELYLPIIRSLGMDLTNCWHSPLAIGEDVSVMTTVRIEDWGQWDELRGRLVMSPGMAGWITRKRGLVRRGRRTFYQAKE